MITSLYYYNFYKPYMMKDIEDRKKIKAKKKFVATKSEIYSNNEDASYMLNKSLKKEIIDYTRSVSSSVIATKESSRHMLRSMELFNRKVNESGLENAKENVSRHMESFVFDFNKSMDFFENQKHSTLLRGYAFDLSNKILMNEQNLEDIYIKTTDGNILNFEAEKFLTLDQDDVNFVIAENISLFNELYCDAQEILQAPLIEHMHFKELNFYYSYKMGTLESESFKIIESGMIIDAAL